MITQWYDPEPGPAALPGVLARELARRGHDVTVVTGFPNYPTGTIAPGYHQQRCAVEHRDGVRVVRTPLYPNHGTGLVGRILNYGSFAVSSTLWGVRHLRGSDVVWVNYSPITVALPMLASRLLHRVPLVTEVADLWPDTLLVSGFGAAGMRSQLASALLHRWVDAMYRASDAVVHIAPSVADVLRSRGVAADKLVYIPKPGNEQVFRQPGSDLRAGLEISADTVVLLYAGSMGAAQGLETLIEALEGVDPSQLVCLLAGGGTMEADLRRRARQVPAARFIGRVAPERMPDLMATADVAYISLVADPLTPLTLPSKTQATMASGLPALVAATGDVVAVVEGSEAGLGVDQSSPRAIREAIDRLAAMGRVSLAQWGTNAGRAYEDQFSVRTTTDAVEQLLEEVAGRPARRGENEEFTAHRLRRRHIPQVAALHRAAFPDFFLSQLGEGFLREFYAGFLEDPDAVTAVVEDGAGHVVAAAVGSTSPAGFFRRLLRRRWAGFAYQSAKAALRAPRRAPRLLRAVGYRGGAPGVDDPDGALLSSVFVAPGRQGAGVGRLVLEGWTRRASGLGADRAFLTTDASGNDAVNAFYQRAGWSLDTTYTTPEGRPMNRYITDLAVSRPTEAGVTS
ncbi:GNAT family N-acetyltransferase [Micrococcus sp. EYE_162]|uniref:GNAT family N-acetyltransferase n=1 Tax=unclassified Micrococcus TaxID=2620948 RepID=UPI0020038A77|nr:MULTISPECIES: GNAT family N-acetyltransferase [unclassified Micrococcus]MCK6095142.1 GNAT family N-acetyltransferase [Micrococcus sp. EYE_212]MCK6171089.1 GNAT family N-acetyltransferase [Micrococcus sp. EYE_162]